MKTLLAVLMIASVLQAPPRSTAFDVLILNGHIVDGTGSPWYAADIGIRDGKVAAILAPRIPISPEYQGEPVPSTMWPLMMTVSNDRSGVCARDG